MLAYVGLLIGLCCGTCSAQMLTDFHVVPNNMSTINALSSFRQLLFVFQFTSAPVGSDPAKDGMKTDEIQRRENVNTSLC